MIIFIINLLLVCITVLVHYEILHWLSIYIPRLKIKYRFRVVSAVIGALVGHIIEIWIFAAGYYFMIGSGNLGTLTGNLTGTFMDCLYYSFVTYTSLGLGDISPSGPIRFTTGLESLTGLVLITWSASFVFIEMQKFWHNHD